MPDPFETAHKYHQQGQLDLAEKGYREVLELQPEHPRATHLLGIVRHQIGDHRDAIVLIRRAIALAPEFAKFHHSLAVVLAVVGELGAAEAACRDALRIRPGYFEACRLLGAVLIKLGRCAEAEAQLRIALEWNSQDAATWNALGNALREQNKRAEAVRAYRAAVDADSEAPEAHSNLGQMMRSIDVDQAYHHCRRAVELEASPAALSNLGNVLRLQGRLEEARKHYETAMNKDPACSTFPINLALLELELGNMEAAERRLRQTLSIDVNSTDAYWGLVFHHLDGITDRDRQEIRRILTTVQLDDRERANLHFCQARICDDLNDFEEAASEASLANAARATWNSRQFGPYDPRQHDLFVTNLIKTFTTEYFSRVSGFGIRSELPVFIVGMPRSGTTLTEQLLASHPQTHGAGELSHIRNSFDSLP